MTGLGGVYIIQSPSGKYRVGLTKNFVQRFYTYQSDARKQNHKHPFLYAIRKYGWSAMRISLLPLPPEEMEEEEKRFIWLLRADDLKFGYNLTTGGEHSKIYTPEARARMSANRKGKGLGPCPTKANTPSIIAARRARGDYKFLHAKLARAACKPYSAERRFACGKATRGKKLPEVGIKIAAALTASLIGRRFGKWIVKELLPRALTLATRPLWLVECDCGNKSRVPTSNLTCGYSTQCRSCAGHYQRVR